MGDVFPIKLQFGSVGMKILGVKDCGLPIYGSAIPKQPANTRQTLKEVSNRYESAFFKP